VKWNFTKFLIGRDGRVLRRFAPASQPEAIAEDIERALSAPVPASRSRASRGGSPTDERTP